MTCYARRQDGTQAEVVQALRACGCQVEDTSWIGRGWPDLMVRLGTDWHAIEVKSRTGKLRQAQEAWRDRWGIPFAVLRSADEAIAWVTAQRRAA
jgi:hypothetical protein